MLPRIATIGSPLRSFQYKILNSILYLTERLYKFNIVDSHYAHSGAYNDSIKHIFCTCTVTQRLWHQLRSWMQQIRKALRTPESKAIYFRTKNSFEAPDRIKGVVRISDKNVSFPTTPALLMLIFCRIAL